MAMQVRHPGAVRIDTREEGVGDFLTFEGIPDYVFSGMVEDLECPRETPPCFLVGTMYFRHTVSGGGSIIVLFRGSSDVPLARSLVQSHLFHVCEEYADEDTKVVLREEYLGVLDLAEHLLKA